MSTQNKTLQSTATSDAQDREDAFAVHEAYIVAHRNELSRLMANVPTLAERARATKAARSHMFKLSVSDRLNRIRLWNRHVALVGAEPFPMNP